MGSVALDANVVIGFLEPTDALHDQARSLLGPWLEPGHTRSMSAVAYAESLVHPLQRGADGIVDAFVDDAQIHVVAADRALARRAAELRGALGLALGDAYVLASAVLAGAELLTLDERLGAAARGLA